MSQNCWVERKYGVRTWWVRIDADVHLRRSNVFRNEYMDESGFALSSGLTHSPLFRLASWVLFSGYTCGFSCSSVPKLNAERVA